MDSKKIFYDIDDKLKTKTEVVYPSVDVKKNLQ